VDFPFGLKMQEHKTAKIAQAQQSSASGALLGELQFSVSARLAPSLQGWRQEDKGQRGRGGIWSHFGLERVQ
jgi:hypothetical protein